MSDLINTLRSIALTPVDHKRTLEHYQEVERQAREAVIDKANALEQYREATGQSFPKPSCKEESAWPKEWDLDEQELLTADPGYRDWMAQQETKD